MNNKNYQISKKIIAGHELTLLAGLRYYASRPMAQPGQKVYSVTIKPYQTVFGQCVEALTIEGLTYDQANAFINEFNNGPISWQGRIW